MKKKFKQKSLIVLLLMGFIILSCSKKDTAGETVKSDEVEIEIQNIEVSTSTNEVEELLSAQEPVAKPKEEFSEKNDNEADDVFGFTDEDLVFIKEMRKEHQKDPNFWNNDIQKNIYEKLLEKRYFDEMLKFREFIESLAEYHHWDPVYEYNPVFLCFEKDDTEALNFLLENNKDLFTKGSLTYGMYSISPLVYVLREKSLEDVKLFFENNIEWNQKEELLYGTRDSGGPRFGMGGNILQFAKDDETVEYLIQQGVETEIDAPQYFSYTLKKDSVSIYTKDDKDFILTDEISNETNFMPTKVLAYAINNQRWVKIQYGENLEKEGWILRSDIDYDTGI